jgi:hypothetical protein
LTKKYNEPSLSADLKPVIEKFGIPVMTGFFRDGDKQRSAVYVVMIPVSESFELYADDTPYNETQTVRLYIVSGKDTTILRRKIALSILKNGFTISDRSFESYNNVSGEFIYTIDVTKDYELEWDFSDG